MQVALQYVRPVRGISIHNNGLSHSTSLLKMIKIAFLLVHLSRVPPSSNGFGSTAAAAAPYANIGRLHPSSTSPSATAANKASGGLGGGGGGGGESDSDPPQQPQPQHNRSRQKKFLKNFSQLPTATEEVVLQSELRQEGRLKRKTISSVKRGQIYFAYNCIINRAIGDCTVNH